MARCVACAVLVLALASRAHAHALQVCSVAQLGNVTDDAYNLDEQPVEPDMFTLEISEQDVCSESKPVGLKVMACDADKAPKIYLMDATHCLVVRGGSLQSSATVYITVYCATKQEDASAESSEVPSLATRFSLMAYQDAQRRKRLLALEKLSSLTKTEDSLQPESRFSSAVKDLRPTIPMTSITSRHKDRSFPYSVSSLENSNRPSTVVPISLSSRQKHNEPNTLEQIKGRAIMRSIKSESHPSHLINSNSKEPMSPWPKRLSSNTPSFTLKKHKPEELPSMLSNRQSSWLKLPNRYSDYMYNNKGPPVSRSIVKSLLLRRSFDEEPWWPYDEDPLALHWSETRPINLHSRWAENHSKHLNFNSRNDMEPSNHPPLYDPILNDHDQQEPPQLSFEEQDQHLPSQDYSEHAPPQDYLEHPHSQDYLEHPHSQDYLEQSHPQDFLEHEHPQDYSDHVPPQDYSEHVPAQDYLEHESPQDYLDHEHPQEYPQQIPHEDSEQLPPHEHLDQMPPQDYLQHLPTHDLQGPVQHAPNNQYMEMPAHPGDPSNYYPELTDLHGHRGPLKPKLLLLLQELEPNCPQAHIVDPTWTSNHPEHSENPQQVPPRYPPGYFGEDDKARSNFGPTHHTDDNIITPMPLTPPNNIHNQPPRPCTKCGNVNSVEGRNWPQLPHPPSDYNHGQIQQQYDHIFNHGPMTEHPSSSSTIRNSLAWVKKSRPVSPKSRTGAEFDPEHLPSAAPWTFLSKLLMSHPTFRDSTHVIRLK